MTRPSPHTKDAASELAECLSLESGNRMLSLIKHLSVAHEEIVRPVPAFRSTKDQQPRPVGIWEPVLREGKRHYVRNPNPGEPSGLWANVARIPPKGPHRRIVLLGESVARGFFFDPYFNPSMALQHVLRELTGDRGVEVTDLARSDLSLEQLRELATTAVDLSPDAVVVLAGNNWTPMPHLSPMGFHELASILRSGSGMVDVKHFLENELRSRVQSIISTLCALAVQHGFLLVIAIPEFNLVDWHTDVASPPLIASGGTAEWLRTRSDAGNRLSTGELDEAQILGRRILALDQGTTPVGCNILAEVSLRRGFLDEARKYLEMARDSVLCSARTDPPRCYSIIQETIRQEALKKKYIAVDLPHVLQTRWNGALPDRRMFLDYCHFTVEATQVSMAAIAEELLPRLFNLQASARRIAEAELKVPEKVVAEAHFLAAIHNANWGQEAQIVRYHCQTALDLSPDVSRMMTLFLDFHIRRAPSSLCKAFEEMCGLQNLAAINLLFSPSIPAEEEFLNEILIEEVIEGLRKTEPGLRAKMESLLTQEHGVQRRSVDLLRKAYSGTSFIVAQDQANRAYYLAHSRTSRFRLVCKSSEMIRLSISYRCRHGNCEEPIAIFVRGSNVACIPPSAKWETAEILLPAEAVRPGINPIEIHWPTTKVTLTALRNDIADNLERTILKEPTPIYGELRRMSAASLDSGGGAPILASRRVASGLEHVD